MKQFHSLLQRQLRQIGIKKTPDPPNKKQWQELLDSINTKAARILAHTNNGQEAINTLENKEFDLILMDCQMPVMDGYTAATTILSQIETEYSEFKEALLKAKQDLQSKL